MIYTLEYFITQLLYEGPLQRLAFFQQKQKPMKDPGTLS